MEWFLMIFTYNFPAIRGIQASKEFFTIMCPLDLLSKLFIFNNENIPEEFRAQRLINEKRIPEIRDYILNNLHDYVFSSITASMDGEYNFLPIESNENIGTLTISMDSNLIINDGQHRKAAIDEAIKDNPHLKRESISVVLFVDQGLKKSQQMFSDLNRHAVNVSSSLSILYNHRDPKVELTKDYLNGNHRLHRYIDQSSTSLAQKSNKMFLLSIFHAAFMNSIGNKGLKNNNDQIAFAYSYWDALSENFMEWKLVLDNEVSPYNSRKESIATYGVVLEALGLIGFDLYPLHKTDYIDYINKLNLIDWSRVNKKDWLNRCIQPNGNIHKSPRMVKLTYIQIKKRLGLELSDTEDALDQEFVKENTYDN
jgi:DNA sulfur modification protein DndB